MKSFALMVTRAAHPAETWLGWFRMHLLARAFTEILGK